VRELAEELGITGADLEKLPEGEYADEFTSYHAYLYTCVWDGQIEHQPEEIDWGAWMSPAELIARLDDPDWPFMPDTAALVGPLVRTFV
jgi:8-oxo-dGTP pyrophosphatase MutT (NUDIX family)